MLSAVRGATVYIKVRGERWRLVIEQDKDAYGTCDCDAKVIRIAPGATQVQSIDTIVHEMLHACLPDLSEDAVAETATDITSALTHKQVLKFLLGCP